MFSISQILSAGGGAVLDGRTELTYNGGDTWHVLFWSLEFYFFTFFIICSGSDKSGLRFVGSSHQWQPRHHHPCVLIIKRKSK